MLSPVLTTAQLAYLIAHTMIGVGVLTLPRDISEGTRGSGYVAIPLAALLNLVPVWLWLRLYQRFPNRSFFWIIDQTLLLQHPLLKTAYRVLWWLPLMVAHLFIAAIVARIFADVVAATALPNTPVSVGVFMMLLTSTLFALMDVEAQMRVNEILFPIVIFPLIVIGALALSGAETYNLVHPLYELTPDHLLKGTLAATFAYQGYQVLSVYGGFLQHPRRSTLAALGGFGVPTLLYLMVTMITIAVFGFEELVRITWPTFELVRVTTFPGLLLERLESAFLTVWMVAVFTTLANTTGAHVLLNQWLFSLKKKGKILMGLAVFVSTLVLALWPRDFLMVDRWSKAIGFYAFGVSVTYPLLLLVLARRVPAHAASAADGSPSGTPNPTDAKGGQPT
ncbi:MAG TPA: GerAB/ArcD/ProY family transporter [Calditerricola sp.]